MKHFRVFGSKCFILNGRENLGKFDAKSNEGTFLEYSVNNRAYRVYNKQTKMVMESISVVIDDAIPEKVLKKVEKLQVLRRMMMAIIPLKVVVLNNNHWKRKLRLSHQEEKLGHPKCHQVRSLQWKPNLQYPVMMSLLRQRNHYQ